MEIVVVILVFVNAFTLLLLAYTKIDVAHNRKMSEIEDEYIKDMINIREEHEKGRVLFPKEKG